MDVDDIAKGVVAALLTDQVDDKTGLATKVGLVVLVVSGIGLFVMDGWLRWLAVVVVLLALAFVLFVFISKRLAKAMINRFASPADIGDVRANFDTAIAEAGIPTGPTSFLRMLWRLRKGVGPEIDRLTSVVNRLRREL
jgi:hypothetical protein